MRIIFFHHAGGDRYSFLPYKALLENIGWESTIYEFPGHGDRFNETLIDDAYDLAEEAYRSMKDELHGDYVLFGNSMGSLIGYLVLHLILENGGTLPKHFFAASRKCPASYPSVMREKPLSKDEFWRVIQEYGGPEALMNNVELQALYEPILRTDHHILETYKHYHQPVLPLPATILYGKHDRYSSVDLNSWSQHFGLAVNFLEFDGGHFFAYEQAEEVLAAIQKNIDHQL